MLTTPQNPAAGLAAVRDRITVATRAALRDPGSVTLIGVCKSQALERLKSALDAGLADLGENYVQEARAHFDALAGRAFVRHFIGPLQSNKTRDVAALFDWVHSVDRLRIAERLSSQRPESMTPLSVCIQVRIGNESTKSGVAPAGLAELAGAVAGLPRLRLRGLMALPPPEPDATRQRRWFAELRRLLEELNAAGHRLDVLSMGMSADFEAAIAEGATHVRVGTSIFGARD
ncbi:MAG TPA: YggS family pyridoxal phosphate-dependent enzyme [Steroidobacteraceae bacterium]|nr:YggS family pyridoxal phosphate-dependent enzyme [Steroidobacteraceae bacterium]